MLEIVKLNKRRADRQNCLFKGGFMNLTTKLH